MNTINSNPVALFDAAAARSTLPTRQAGETTEPIKPPFATQAPDKRLNDEQQERLKHRVETFSRQAEPAPTDNARGRQAVQAYQSLSEIDEREQVSLLLGVDEYV